MKYRRIFAPVLALLMVLMLAGCAEGTEAQEQVERSLTAQSQLSGYQAGIKYLVTYTDGDETGDIIIEGNTTILTQPEYQSKTEVVVGVDGYELPVQAYQRMEDGVLVQYLYDQNDWVRMEYDENDEDVAGMLAPNSQALTLEQQAQQLISLVDGIEDMGTETISEVKCRHYKGSLSGSEVTKLLQLNSPMLETLMPVGNEVSAIPFELWVDEATGLPMRYRLDLKTVMNQFVQSIDETPHGAASCTDAFLLIEIVKTTNLDSVQVPEEALAATR